MARVLIIDDNQDFCHLLAHMVQIEGHESVCAFTLKQGLELASSEPFDVVFLMYCCRMEMVLKN
jgi:two-component system, NtrC family, response regulator